MDVREKSQNEKRMIDYYYLKEKIECPGEPLVYWDDIEVAPTIDAVPVVRCKDCKHYEIHKPKVLESCERNGYIIPMKPYDFCSYGDWKEGAD